MLSGASVRSSSAPKVVSGAKSISATATSKPPSERSWAASTLPDFMVWRSAEWSFCSLSKSSSGASPVLSLCMMRW